MRYLEKLCVALAIVWAILMAMLLAGCKMTTEPVHMTTPRVLLPNAQIEPGRTSSGQASATFERDYVRFVVRKTASNADVGMWVEVDADANPATGLPQGSQRGIEFVFGQWSAQSGTVDLRATNAVYGWSFGDPPSATFPLYETGTQWIAYIPRSYFGVSHVARGWTPYILFASTEGRIAEEVAAIP
jgi:hypothetical protein